MQVQLGSLRFEVEIVRMMKLATNVNADRYLQFLNDGCHLGVVGHLAVAIAVLLHAVDAQAGDVAAEHA